MSTDQPLRHERDILRDRKSDDARPAKPHSIIGVPEAESVLRMLEAGAQGSLNEVAIRHGIATPRDDAATVNKRLRSVAEDALRLHGPGFISPQFSRMRRKDDSPH